VGVCLKGDAVPNYVSWPFACDLYIDGTVNDSNDEFNFVFLFPPFVWNK